MSLSDLKKAFDNSIRHFWPANQSHNYRTLAGLKDERGYPEPQLALLGIPDFRCHLIVSALWGVWHFPLILSTDYTNAPILLFPPHFMVGIIFLAIIFGQMRKSSNRVWPAMLMPGTGNVLGFAILEGKILSFNSELFGSIVPASISTTLVYGLIAFLILQRRNLKRSSLLIPEA